MANQGAPLTARERKRAELLQKRMAEAGGEADQEQLERDGKFSRAKWKIQIWIKSARSIHKPLSFTLTIWESGKRLHGGGDESAFICRKKPSAPRPTAPFGAARGLSKKEPTPEGCGTVISGDNAARGYIVCPDCLIRWDTEHIADAIFYQIPVEKAAGVIADWFRQLEFSADIYVKYRAQDVRVKMMARDYGVRKARQLKGLVIYPMVRIIKDTSDGATLESRFKALLLA